MRFTHVIFAAAALAASPAAAQGWQPTRSVEFVVTAGAGGGTDVFARTVQSIIQRHNLMSQSIVVTNKGGGSGAEGFVDGKLAAGNPHKIIFGTSNQWMLPMVARVAWRYDEMTPIAAMAFDEFMLWVNRDAPFQSARDFITAVRAQPEHFRMGGSQSRDVDQLLTRLMEKATGTRFTYVPFRSGGEAGVQLAGGHISANTNNPSESIGQWRGNQVRPLCVFAPQRLPAGPLVTETQGWHDVPTCREQGIAIDEYRMPRAVFLPPNVPPAALAFYTELFRKISETPEWAEYIQRTSQTARFMAGDELRRFITEDERKAREIFREEGWLVN